MSTELPRPSAYLALVMARFLEETKHLGLEGQKRVLGVIARANQYRRSWLDAKAAINKARTG